MKKQSEPIKRQCCSCKKTLSLDCFHKDRAKPLGHRYSCKDCVNRYSRERLKQDTEARTRRNAHNREYMRGYSQRPENKAKQSSVERLAWRKEYYKKKTSDPVFKLNNAMRAALRRALQGKTGFGPWESRVGYSSNELRARIESLFEPGMTWSNYGKGGWQIDHVLPLNVWIYTSYDDHEFRLCWSLNNLRPCWAVENARKYDHVL